MRDQSLQSKGISLTSRQGGQWVQRNQVDPVSFSHCEDGEYTTVLCSVFLVMVNIQGRCLHKLCTLWICRRGICAAEQAGGRGGVKGSDASGLRFLCTRPSGDDNSLSSLWELETISLQNKEEEEKGWLLLSLELATGQRGGLSFLQEDHLSAGGITFIGAQVFVQRMVQLPCNFQKFRYKSWFCEDVWEMFLNCSSSFGWRRSPQCGYSCGVNDIMNRSILFKTVLMH